MNKLKISIILLILLIIYTLVCALSYVEAVSTNISEGVFRLHVLANSDSKEDQDLKYIVRDKVLEYMNQISLGVNQKEEFIQLVTNHTDKIEEIAKQTILDNGYNYDVTVEVGNFAFPTKTYGDISLPASFYDAVRIKIGEAKGQNWWCVMFPPLCFVDVTSGIVDEDSKAILEQNLEEEEYALISEDSGIVKFKFKLLEMFESFNIKIATIN